MDNMISVSPRLYACYNCHNHVALHDDIVSKTFQVHHGRAFLFSHVMNVVAGIVHEQHMLTGLHRVADVSCSDCGEVLGWTYEKAYEETQKYKEGNRMLSNTICLTNVKGQRLEDVFGPFQKHFKALVNAESLGNDGKVRVYQKHYNVIAMISGHIFLYIDALCYDDQFFVTPRVSALVEADQLLHYEVEGQVDGLVEEVEELENQRAKLVDELENKMVKEVAEMQKLETEFWVHAMVGVGHAAYTDRFHELARLVPHLVTPENKRIKRYIYGLALQIRAMVAATEPIIIQSVVLKAGMLTDEAIRNGSLKKNTEKIGNGGEPSRDGNVRDGNKRYRTGRAFASTINPGRKEAGPRMVNPLNAKNLTAASGACYECGAMAIEGGQGHGNNGNQARGRAFVMRAEEASPVCKHYDGIEPSNLGFSYEIEIASIQLVEINKVMCGCKLEIGGHTFDIDLIPFGHESFDVIVGMDWLSRHKAEIFFHEKVVRIPLPRGEMLRVLGERPQEKVKHLMSARTKGQKLKDIIVVRNFSKVFPDDLSGLPPS
ncbi:reverse transcriptase domain-containing protein [Tanacetum coccineum]|uniref:Reverse transcriptase domain-containing protein n=1 Tax=Tanacetum coccineum TaxID=301880 RepID=A0ABQ5AQG9_9ASTR